MKTSEMSTSYLFILFVSAIILCASYPLATADLPSKICKPDPEKCLDGLEDCKSSQVCYYGDCTPYGSCDCFDCFHGDKCDKYSDNAMPRFDIKSDIVTIFGIETGEIYQAAATDADATTECPSGVITSDKCLCAAVSYSIISDEHQNFRIDAATGNVYIEKHENIEKGRTYHITILAQGFFANGTLSSYQDVMELTVSVEDVKEEDNSVRVKRSPSGTTEDSTVITLTKVTDPSLTDTKLGDKIDYKMEIWVPKLSAPMDLKVEIFTSDPETKQAAFALMKPVISKGTAVTVTNDPPVPVMQVDHFYNFFYDRTSIDFGDVNSNSGGTAGDSATKADSLITIDFSVITISTNATHPSPYRVSAGAEYKSQSFVWVGQSQLSLLTEDVAFDTMATIDGADTIEQDSFETYTVKSILAGPSPDVTFAAFLTVGEEDVISIGSIGTTTIGSAFTANVDFAADRDLAKPVYAYSVSKNSILSSSFNAPLIAAEVVTDTTNNEITWIFSVWAIGGIAVPTDPLKLGIAMQLGEDKIWTGVKSLTITAGTPAESGTLTFKSADLASTDSIPPGGTAIIQAKFHLSSGGKKQVKLTIDVVDKLSHCETRLTMRGFNIPYIPHANLTTTTDGTKTEIDLGYIGNTGQITEDGDKNLLVNEFWFEIGIRTATDTTDGTYDVTVEAGGTTKTASIAVAAASQVADDVSVTIGPSEGSTDSLTAWKIGSAAAVDIAATFPAKHAVTDMTVEGTGMLNNFDFDVRVCKIDVSFMGADIPCIERGPQQFEKTADTRKYNDYAVWDIGSMCSAARSPAGANATWDNKVTFTVSYEIPFTEASVTTDPYSLSAGLKLGTDKIWAGLVPFTPSTTKVGSYSGTIQPLWNSLAGSVEVAVDKINIGRFFIKIPPGATGVLKIEITVVAAQLVMCPLQIRFGSGLPCEDDQPFKKWADSDPTTLNYEHDASTEAEGAVKAILDLKSIHNIGTAPLVSSNVFDSNTIEIILPVYVKDSGSATVALTGTGITSFSKAHAFTKSASAAVESTIDDVTITMEEDTETGTYTGFKDGIAKTAFVKVELKENFYAKPFVLEISNTQSFNICCAAFSFVGANLPCVNASKVPWEQVPEASPAADGSQIMSTLKITMDKLCQYPIRKSDKQPEANTFVVMVGFKVPKDASHSKITLTAKATVAGGSKEAALEIAKTVDVGKPVIEEPDKGGAVELLDDTDGNNVLGEPLDVNIGQFIWLKFAILTISSSIAEYQAAAFGRVQDSRAEITVHDIKINTEETGMNVVCVNDAHEFEVIIGKANDTLPESQDNMLLLKFGPILNTGVAKKVSSETPEDNKLVLEVLIRITDHVQNTHDKTVMLDVGGMMGKQIVITQQPLVIKRRTTDNADIVIDFTYNNDSNREYFVKNDDVNVFALIHHTNDTSSREPAPGYIRFLWGPYMKYKENSIEVNATYDNPQFPLADPTTTHMDVEFPYILFGDWISIKFTLQTDPDEVRQPGSGIINAITLARAVCKYDSQSADGGTSPASAANKYFYCGEISHVAYDVNAPECYDDLKFEELDDACIIASSAADEGLPKDAKDNSLSAWLPAYGPKQSKDYLIVNFLQKVRVTKVEVFGKTGERKVTEFKIEAGDSEYGFQSPQNGTVGTDGVTILDKAVVGQFIRFTIVQAESDDSKYVGVRLKFYGCKQGSPVLGPCAFQQKTRQGANWRNVAYDSGNDYIYSCYYNEDKENMNCFCSHDGKRWKEMPFYIGYMIGEEGGKMYAYDLKKTTVMSSPDCVHWSVDTLPGSISSEAVPVPGNKEVSEITIGGGWTATEEGLKKGGVLYSKWYK